MGQDLLIVGDPDRRAELAERIHRLGYQTRRCAPHEFNRTIRLAQLPRAVLICADDGDGEQLLLTLRRCRPAALLPASWVDGDGPTRLDLGAALDLGADHKLDLRVDDQGLLEHLLELCGPPSGRTETAIAWPEPAADGEPSRPTARERARQLWTTTERVDERVDVAPSAGPTRPRRPARTPIPSPEITGLDFPELPGDEPDVEPGLASLDPELLDEALSSVSRRPGRSPARRLGPDEVTTQRDPTQRLHAASPRPPPRPDPAGDDDGWIHPPSPNERALSRRRWLADGGGSDPELEGTGPRRRPPADPERTPPTAGRGGGPTRSAPSGPTRALEPSAPHRSPSLRGASDRPAAGAPGGSASAGPPDPGAELARAAALALTGRIMAAGAGNLAATSVAELLWDAATAKSTGRLELSRAGATTQVWFEDGALVGVRSDAEGDRFVDGLYSRGILSRGQWETARRLAAKDSRRAGRLLIEAGFIKPDELELLLAEHFERLLAKTLAWADGTWRFSAGLSLGEPDAPALSVERAIVRGLKLYLDEAELRIRLGSLEVAPRLAGLADAGELDRWSRALGLDDRDRAILGRFDGVTRLSELIARPAIDPQRCLALALGLSIVGRVERVGGPAGVDPAAIEIERILARLAQIRVGDYFALLGVRRDADRLALRRAHADLVEAFAPERFRPEVRERFGAELAELRATFDEALALLDDPTTKSAYLAHLSDDEDDEPSPSDGAVGQRGPLPRGAEPGRGS